jgi:RNA polymerase sigma-70 factor (ECF subfamily)
MSPAPCPFPAPALLRARAGGADRAREPAAPQPPGASLAAEERHVIEQARGGSHEAFAVLVGAYQERIFNYLLRLTGHWHDAEDLAQLTFLKAYRGLGRYDPRFAFGTWLFTIAKRAALRRHASQRPAEPLSAADELPARDADPAVRLLEQEARTSLWSVARRLKPRQFEALWLRYAEGFSVAETARIMGLHGIYVRVLLHRGRRQLAARLRQDGAPPGAPSEPPPPHRV